MAEISFLAASFIMNVIAILFFVCAVVLILVVLIQKGRGGGLSAALGGGMASGILGSKTGDFLTWVTVVVVCAFLTLAVVMAKFYKPSVRDFGEGPARSAPIQQEQPATELPTSAEDAGAAAGDVDEGVDVNSLGG
jgi:preprotein translocase subunit SecG